jgi:8-oxo-dGTP diphosphatase
MPNAYDQPRPAFTVDCVVVGFDDADLKVLLIQHGTAPYCGK